jgi:hypothetical protein
LSEFFDEFEPGVKYGADGPALRTLKLLSERIRELEDLQLGVRWDEEGVAQDAGRLQEGMLESIANLRKGLQARTR